MAVERNVRYPHWMQNAVKKFQETNKFPSFSKAAIFLIESELNRRGYFRASYEPNVVDLELTDGTKSPNETLAHGSEKVETANEAGSAKAALPGSRKKRA